MVPPPFSIHLSPPLARPSPLFLLLLCSPIPSLCFCEYRVPVDGPGVFYTSASCTSNSKILYDPSFFHLHHLAFTFATQPACKSINHSTDPISKETEKPVKIQVDKRLEQMRDEVTSGTKVCVRCVALHTTTKFVGEMNYGKNVTPHIDCARQKTAKTVRAAEPEGVSNHTQNQQVINWTPKETREMKKMSADGVFSKPDLVEQKIGAPQR